MLLPVFACVVTAVALYYFCRFRSAAKACAASKRGRQEERCQARAELQEEQERAQGLQQRCDDYERALGLPFYSDDETRKALWARAYHGDEVASDVLQARFTRELEDSVPGFADAPAPAR